MNVNWISAASIFKIKGGTQPPKSQFIYKPHDGYIRLIQIRDFDNDSHITYVKESLSLSKCDEDDILIGRYGAAVGRICRGLSGAYNVALVKATPFPGVCKAFLFYLLNSNFFQNRILSVSGRSAQAGFNRDDLKSIYLPLPPLPEQRRIATILGALDDKIENNRKTAATLEEMARALYRSWFVDFDPVHARAEGHAPAHMDAATAALFPDRFGEDGLPEGWKNVSFTDVFNIVGGGTPKKTHTEYWNGKIDWYSLTDLPQKGEIYIYNTKDKITKEGLEKSSARVIPKGSTIISARGSVGKIAIAAKDMTFNQSCYGIYGRENLMQAYSYFSLEISLDHLKNMAHGSVFSTITRQTFKNIEIISPPNAVLKNYENKSSLLLNKIRSLGAENQTLATLRDTLLPRLMSGELRVSAAKEMVEEASS